MFSKLARGAYLFVVAAMVVVWAISATKSSPVDEPQDEQTIGRMYS